MTGENINERDYESLFPSSSNRLDGEAQERETLKRPSSYKDSHGKEAFSPLTKNGAKETESSEFPSAETSSTAAELLPSNKTRAEISPESEESLPYSSKQKLEKEKKRGNRDEKLLRGDRWLARNGHTVTYVGLFLFTFTVYFRPYELVPALSGFTSLALIIALVTLFVFVPSQLAAEGTFTSFPTEVKCILFIAGWALITMPIAKDPQMAWTLFYDTFAKVVIIFVIMVNTLRSMPRAKGLMWLGIGIGVMLSNQAIDLYNRGVFNTEGYRVSVDFGGMFGNPNDMSLHLVMFIPIALTMGIASRNPLGKFVYFGSSVVMATAVILTQSRGGFLGLIVMCGVLIWKLGGRNRLQVMSLASVITLVIFIIAPGNFGFRILSIFLPGLDPVGSSDQRRELLYTSLLVTLRNPLGIGLGNFPIVGDHNQQSHNAYTQVSSELGWLAFIAYLILLVSPYRKLGAVVRQLKVQGEFSWTYYLSIGVQASLAGYMTASFFGSVAYNWYLYFPVAFAVCLRRMHTIRSATLPKFVEKSSALGTGKTTVEV